MLMNTNRRAMNDGFYATKVPNVVYGAYFVKPKDVFKAWSVLVDAFMDRKDDRLFPWNGPPELRFLTVADDAVLNPVEPGLWAVSEFLGFPTGRSDQGWKSAFRHVEDEWVSRFGAKPHLGKSFAWGTAADGTVQPYLREKVCKVYSDAQKSAFEAYRRRAPGEPVRGRRRNEALVIMPIGGGSQRPCASCCWQEPLVACHRGSLLAEASGP